MSNSRIFATVWFVTFGMLCFFAGKGVTIGTRPGWDEPTGMVVLATMFACGLVALFGDRRPA